ncbi:hypothetical protein V5O48_012016 [Marasmius crinis-equi]|uniref:Uncharacterized protein n=1 Tax=Marasmius crinis-equi TaxID=585013 RepID=A0ABR3F3X9_9AGAR
MKSSTATRKPEQKASTSRSKSKPGKNAESSTSTSPPKRGQKRNLEMFEEDDDEDVSHELSAAAKELKRRVQEVYTAIDGNTADGRWGIISRLLKLPCTSGHNGVWITPRPGEMEEPENLGFGEERSEETVIGSRSGRSSKESTKEAKLKEKVEEWQKNIVVEAAEVANPKVKRKSTTKKSNETSVSVEMDIDPSPLGFRAQKLSASQLKAKMKANKPVAKKTIPDPPSDVTESPESRPTKRRRHITDVPEHNFVPPPFSSSQIQHSTPYRKPTSVRPPSPILPAETSPSEPHVVPPPTSSPPSPSGIATSPITTVTRNRARRALETPNAASKALPQAKASVALPKSPVPGLGLSSSLPAFGTPKVPTKAEAVAPKLGLRVDTNEDDADDGEKEPPVRNFKRPGPRSPETPRHAKQRCVSRVEDVSMHPPSSPLSSPPNTPIPATPKKSDKNQLPTLTELLSAKKSASPKARSKRPSGVAGLDVCLTNKVDEERRTSGRASGVSPHSQAPSNKIETQRTTATTVTTTTIQGRQPGWEAFPIQTEDPHSLQSLPEYANAVDFTVGYGFDITAPPASIPPPMDGFGIGDDDGEIVQGSGEGEDEEEVDQVSIPQSSVKEPVLVPDSPAIAIIPDFTFHPEEFSPQLTSTQPKDNGNGGGGGSNLKIRGDVFMGMGTGVVDEDKDNNDDDDDLMAISPPKRTPVRGGAARYSSQPSQTGPSDSRSPSKSPSKSQSYPWGYSSQMDLEGGVDRVSRFLEKDISMVDVEEEDEEEERGDGDRDGFSIGPGKSGWVY